jgi:hypothetical protein
VSSIKTKRSRRSKTAIKSTNDLYGSIGVDPSLTIEDEEYEDSDIITENISSFIPAPLIGEYDYNSMAIEYSKVNVPQQLGNYRSAMNYLTHYIPESDDELNIKLQHILYNYPNVDISSFLNKENAALHSWICEQMFRSFGEKYLGSIYVLGGGIGLLAAGILDSKLRYENIRSFDINGTGQFLADELMADNLLNNWRFKATTQDVFNIEYTKNVFSTVLQNGTNSRPFEEIPGTVINYNISYLTKYEKWWDMLPDMRRVVVAGESGDVPRPFSSSNSFNRKFPMTIETYSGVKKVGDKYFFMKIGYK